MYICLCRDQRSVIVILHEEQKQLLAACLVGAVKYIKNTAFVCKPESDNFNIGTSIVYSHQYFKKIEDTDTAVCLTCQKHNEGIGSKEPKRKDTFSAAGSSTSGNNLNTFIVIFYLFTFMFSQVVKHTYSGDTRALFWTNSWLRKRSSIN